MGLPKMLLAVGKPSIVTSNGFKVDTSDYERRSTLDCDTVYHKIGSQHLPRVELSLSRQNFDSEDILLKIYEMLGQKNRDSLAVIQDSNGKPTFKCETAHITIKSADELKRFQTLRRRLMQRELYMPFAVDFSENADLASDIANYADRLVFSPERDTTSELLNGVVCAAKIFGKPIEWKLTFDQELGKQVAAVLKTCKKLDYWNLLFSLSGSIHTPSLVQSYRSLAYRLDDLGANFPILLRYKVTAPFDCAILDVASQFGSLLCDGIGDVIHIESDISVKDLLRLSYNILQATRLRISKTEYISCPSCGRTLFDLQTTTERIKSKTDHLKGVKIAIMGCIVNGPGEMADADFGYVGAGLQKVNLFVGKECVQHNIPEEEADERLMTLIREHGKWVEP